MSSALEVVGELHRLRAESPEVQGHWDRLCRSMRLLGRADAAVILIEDSENQWLVLGQDPAPAGWLIDQLSDVRPDLSKRALTKGFAVLPRGDAGHGSRLIGAVRVLGLDRAIVLLDIPGTEKANLNELLLRVQVAASLPPMPAPETSITTASDPELVNVVDLVASVMRERRFPVAALALVNGIVARFDLTQVALGWDSRGYVRIQAISHLDRFERKMEESRNLEAAFEEAVDQASLIEVPGSDESTLIVHANQQLRQSLGHGWVCTLPLSQDSEDPRAALMIAGGEEQRLSPDRLRYLQLALDLLLPWLSDLRARDRWWWLRLGAWARDRLSRLLGREDVGRKVLAALASVAVFFLVFGKWDFRVEVPAQLATDSTRQLGAPFDGFVAEVFHSAGDVLQDQAVLAELDTQDLYLEESEMLADISRFRAEADLARAENRLAELEIARARQAQAEARLARVRYQIAQAALKAPFAGVVVEGERRDLLGAPVRQGDPLFRIARVENLYLVLSLSERDVRFLKNSLDGEAALLARPDQRIPFEIRTLIPMAEVRDQDGNFFEMKADITGESLDWWRPGMTGVGKIDVGKKPILWILTHRLIDDLRLWLWL